MRAQATKTNFQYLSFQMQQLPEYEIAKGVLKGDSKSEAALYRRYCARMFSVCQRYADNRQEAEDMLQEGFIRVFADLRDFRFEGSLEGWVRRVVIRTALRYLRNKKNVTSLEAHDMEAEGCCPDELLAEEIDSSHKVIELMQHLPQGYRTVLNLYAIEGYSHEEIAGLLQISIGTSKSQLFKARNMLRSLLEKSIQKVNV